MKQVESEESGKKKSEYVLKEINNTKKRKKQRKGERGLLRKRKQYTYIPISETQFSKSFLSGIKS